MATKSYEKIKSEIKKELLEEFVFPILKNVKDTEGEYKSDFVKNVTRASQEKPSYTYNPKSFWGQIGYKK